MFSFIKKIKEKKKNKINNLNEKIISNIDKISKAIESKKELNFLHSGHLGDLINSLPTIKEISKQSKCNLFVNLEKEIDKEDAVDKHPSKKFYLSSKSYDKLIPLLKVQSYLSNVSLYKEQPIDVNLDFFRDLPINFNVDSVRWYFHLTGINTDLSVPYLTNIGQNDDFKNNIVIMRSLRRQNKDINFNFLEKYENVLFIGLYNEYLDLKKQISNLKFYDCKNFLEMAEIINSSKLFIGNLSFGYTIAEALKKPRLLESFLNFPLVYPNGAEGYEFYFQTHFEKFVKKIIKS